MLRGSANEAANATAGFPNDVGRLETERVTALAADWGMEAGFLGVDGRIEPRLSAILDDCLRRLFGDFEAERDRAAADIESGEAALDEARQAIEQYRSRYGVDGQRLRAGWVRRLRTWLWLRAAYRSGLVRARKELARLREARPRFENAEIRRKSAAIWRQAAMQAAMANFEFQRQRAALARERKEEHFNDNQNSKRFISRRAG